MKLSTERAVIASRKNGKLGGRPAGSIEDTTAYKKAFTAYVVSRVFSDKEALIDAMLEKAKNGDVTAFTALRDTAIGKPAQAVELSGQNGQPMVFLPIELMDKHGLRVIEAEKVENKANIEKPH